MRVEASRPHEPSGRPPGGHDIEDVWRSCAPHVLGVLLRRHADFADCEDAVQLALIAAAEQWRRDGVPANPAAWLTQVARRRLVDIVRSDAARRSREERAARLEPDVVPSAPLSDDQPVAVEDDDTLALLLLCAHPALSPASQVALMLRAVCGLTTREIATCFFVPEATMAQRISRAKATLREAGGRFSDVQAHELPVRLHAVRHAISALYTRAHAVGPRRVAGSESDPASGALLAETAVQLARDLNRLAPADAENAGLLALLLLTEARAATRLDDAGDLVPLDAQDRTRWDAALIDEGVRLLERALPTGYVGTFQLQAAIAAVHAEAPTAEATDWPQILALYEMLARVDPTPAATLGRAVATAEVVGPEAGLLIVAELPETSHRRHAAAGHMLQRLGRDGDARTAFLRAAELTRSIPEQRYLNALAGAVSPPDGGAPRD